MTIKQLKLGRRGEARTRPQRPPRDLRPAKPERHVRYHSLSLPSLYWRVKQ